MNASAESIRDFRLFMISKFCFTIGTQMMSVVVGWQVYELTHSTLSLGLIGLAQFLPVFGLTLFAGMAADRFDRRDILLVCNLLSALCAALLCALSYRGGVTPTEIYLILIFFGVARAFASPANSALVPDMVSNRYFKRAVAINSSVWQTATIIGPALGGIVHGWTRRSDAVYLLATALIVVTFILNSLLKVRTGRSEKAPVTFQSVMAGIHYVWKKKLILGSISLDLFAVLLGGATALLPVYAKDILNVGPAGLGLLRSAPSFGAALVALFLAYRPLQGKLGRSLFVSVFLFGLLTIVFGLSTHFFLSLACLVVMGGADLVSVVIRHTLVQLETPPNMRGRVSAVEQIFIGASNELGEFESGTTAAWFGTVPAVLIGGVGTCLIVSIWALLFPELRKLDQVGEE